MDAENQPQDAPEITSGQTVTFLDKLELLLEKTEMTLTAQKQLEEHFQSKLQYDSHKEKIIDSLHSELQSYKKDVVKKAIQPLILDIINTIDNLKKKLDRERITPSSANTGNVFEDVIGELTDVLVRQGITAYEQSGVFDAAKQKIISIIGTDDVAKDKTIERTLYPGYEWEGKILRPELINVFKYNAAEDEQKNSE